ncbi:hypothetical protein [Nocardia sp. NBC_00403]|uniref:hypothetical protein n=1 Tax=Nocardia sp. NBC_00403 TaxID=2975990 RepID=UPI002E1EB2B9
MVSVAPGGIESGITHFTRGHLPQNSDWSQFGRLKPPAKFVVGVEGPAVCRSQVPPARRAGDLAV